jgi:hypothetical protein
LRFRRPLGYLLIIGLSTGCATSTVSNGATGGSGSSSPSIVDSGGSATPTSTAATGGSATPTSTAATSLASGCDPSVMTFVESLGTVQAIVGSVSTTAAGAVAWAAVRYGPDGPKFSRWSQVPPTTPVSFCLALGYFDKQEDPVAPPLPGQPPLGPPVLVVIALSKSALSLEYDTRDFHSLLPVPLPGVLRDAVPALSGPLPTAPGGNTESASTSSVSQTQPTG